MDSCRATDEPLSSIIRITFIISLQKIFLVYEEDGEQKVKEIDFNPLVQGKEAIEQSIIAIIQNANGIKYMLTEEDDERVVWEREGYNE